VTTAKLVDLSFPISEEIPRWKVQFTSVYRTTSYKSSQISLPLHALTHLDSPLHYIPDGISIEQFPLELAISEAAVIDLTYAAANERIDVGDIASRFPSRHAPTVLLRTDWPKRSWRTPDFWAASPYITEEAALWLAEQKIKIIGYDFPQEYPIRKIATGEAKMDDFRVHLIFLSRGIWQIEYLMNLDRIGSSRCLLYLFPLALTGLEASPVRVVASPLEH